MKSNKSKKCILSHSGNFNVATNLPQVKSNSNLNSQFWHSLRDTINTRKESQSIKGRIFTAKRILTPIIQELMKDAMEQMEAENLEDVEEGASMKGKEIKVLYNNVRAKDVWHVQTDVLTDGEEWAMKILREISRDLEQPFNKVRENVEVNEIAERSPKNILLNKKLLTKLLGIHQHLGNLIERLKERCQPKMAVLADNDSLNDLRNRKFDIETSTSIDTECFFLGKPKESRRKPCNVNPFSLNTNKEYITQSTFQYEHSFSLGEKKNACSSINFENLENPGFAMSSKLLYDVALFEENKNNVGNKEIVIKCLEDLEKVRTYLEAMRDNKECEKPKFCDLESCKNDECLESQPHLHSKRHNTPMVLKLNKHAEENERNSDLIIGIPNLTKSSPDVHILLNTNNQPKETSDQANPKNQQKIPYRVSRIPKPIDKHQVDLGKFVKSNSMKITLENKQGSRRKPANLLIFDPADPSKSIIKMKEQKKEELSDDARSVVSKTCFTNQENLIIHITFCCVGGEYTKLKFNIEIWLVSSTTPLGSSITKLHVFILIVRPPSSAVEPWKLRVPEVEFDEPKQLKFSFNAYLDNYIDNLFSFISFIKGPLKTKNQLNQKGFYLQNSFNSYKPKRKTLHKVYFFQCFKENKEKVRSQSSSQRNWNYQSQNAATYPIWTIKRSKYYSVPQSKTKEQVVLEQHADEKEHEEAVEPLKLEELDSLENVTGSHHEIHMQISKVSVRSTEDEELEDKTPKKTEVRRKVSFRDEVSVSGSVVDNQDLEPQNILPFPPDGDPSYLGHALEKSPSIDIQEDIKKLSSRISDLLMTDSLMKIAEEIPKRETKKLKKASRRSSPKNLKLTDSARNVLAKLSKSFQDVDYSSVSGTLEGDMEPQFFDEEGNAIAEVYNSVGDLLFSLKNNNIDGLTPVLFNSSGILFKNRYNVDGQRIKAVYDENGRTIRRLSQNNEDMKSVQADLEKVVYFDQRGKPIKQLYDSSGYAIKTVGKDLSSRIFDANGRMQMDIYTRKGRRIVAVFDSRGHLLGKVSDSRLEPVFRGEQVRVAKMDNDSLSKLFENEKSGSPKRFFDQEGKPLIGVYDKKGKPIKVTSSGEADELVPFLFDTKGKLQSKRYDSKGKELKAVFGEDGKAISGTSIAWLNELLVNSKNDISKTKKKKSVLKKISKSKSRTDKQYDIGKLYDSNGKVITGVFDAKGKPLAVSMSGDATKLLPFLFDKGGKFIKKRYDSEKRKLRCVHGKEGNIIRTISLTYLGRVHAKLESEQIQEKNESKAQIEVEWSSSKVREETVGNMVEDAKSSKSLDCFQKIPDQIYDEDGNVLTDILDEEGNALGISPSGNPWKLLPHLIDEKGQFLEKRYDKKGRQLLAVFNKEGENLNDFLSTAMKIAANEAFESSNVQNEGSDNEQKEGRKYEEKAEIDQNLDNPENNEYKQNKNKNKEKGEKRDSASDLVRKNSPLASQKSSSKLNVTEKKSSTSEQTESPLPKEKQLKPTSSITKKQSVNQKFDIPEEAPKAGESIYRFFDKKGIPVTEVYDYKGRALIRTKSGEVEQLAKFLFDKKGFLSDNIYNRQGRRITKIFDHRKRSISRISLSSIISGENITNKHHQKDTKIPGSVYDENDDLVKEIYDRKGHPMIVTSLAKLEDLAPVIFDEKGVRRRLYDKSGYEIGPVFDHKGNVLKRSPVFKKSKSKPDRKDARIFSKSGRPLHNFYDSEGTLIIALYNDYGKTLCNVKKGVNNVELLSKFFFDKEGHFLKGRFHNFRGQMIRHVYDSDTNIVRCIKRTESRRIAHHISSNRGGDKVNLRKNTGGANKQKMNIAPKHKQRGYHGKSEVRPVENIVRNFSSQSDTVINPGKPLIQRSMSAYSLRDYPVQHEMAKSSSSSDSSLVNMTVKKFYDENGSLLTGVYNSKNRLLGYSASGNARVLAPYLYDIKGNFIWGRYNLDRKPLKHIYDSNGKLVEKISKPVLKKTREYPKNLKDRNGDVITSVYNLRGDKILDAAGSCDQIENLLDRNGKLKRNLYNCRGSKLKIYDGNEETAGEVSSDHEERGSKGRFTALCHLKDKILTVIFDKQHRLSHRLSHRKSNRSPKTKETNTEEEEDVKKTSDEVKSKQKKSQLYDKKLNVISKIYDNRGKIIKKLYNSGGEVIEELFSASGTLVKNNVLKSMFENNVFRPKVFNSKGNIINTIYANDKQLKKVYDEKGEPAKMDSDLIYLVSKQSLPKDDGASTSKSAPKQVNYFSEGSSYPFPEGQNQNSQIKTQQLTEEQNYETEMEVAFNGYSRRRTDECICEHCQKMGKRRNIVQFGGDLLKRLSRFTVPLGKFFPRRNDSDEAESEVDSLETLIDEAGKQDIPGEAEGSDKEYYESCSRVLLEGSENVPISRKMIEKTLKNCVHLNSSTNIVGKVSDTVLQHFANLILQEIEQKFYHKLDVLQCGENDSVHAFQCDGEKDICIGTELKFEDSLIGKHIAAQTTDLPVTLGNCHLCGSSFQSLTQILELEGYFDGYSSEIDGENCRAFVCELPDLQPFIMTMKTKQDLTRKV